jgi:hypothetical protein
MSVEGLAIIVAIQAKPAPMPEARYWLGCPLPLDVRADDRAEDQAQEQETTWRGPR